MWATNTLPLYKCTEESPSPCRQSHVVRFPCGRVKSVAMYPYTRSTWSQTLTVVQHTVFIVQASKRLFHPYNAVVLFNIIINYYYCCGRVWPCCCRLISVDTYATCQMHALSTLELRGGPEHARAIWFTLTSPFVKRLWKLVKPITNYYHTNNECKVVANVKW